MKIFIRLMVFLVLFPLPHVCGKESLVDGFRIVGEQQKKVFIREGNGIRIKTPAPGLMNLLQRGNNLWTVESDFALKGNFEVLVDFDVRQIGPAEGKVPTEANAEISLLGNGRFSVYGININNGPSGLLFKVVRFEPGANGLHYNLLTFPRRSNTGKVGMRREGSELVFLASGSAGGDFKELVRLPYDSRSEPRIRLSGYQGNGSVLLPVDVLFSNFAIKADKLLKEKEINSSVQEDTPPDSYAVNLDYSKNPSRILLDFKRTNDNHQAMKLEGKGIRVKPPVSSTAREGEIPRYWFHDTVYSLEGDFEMSFNFDVKELAPAPMAGYGSATFSMNLESDGALGSFSFGRGVSRGDGQRYSITRACNTSAGRHYDTQSFKTKANQGKLILRKTGEQYFFLVQETEEPARELFRCPAIVSSPVTLRLNVDQGGTNEAVVDALLSEILVKGTRITENGKPVKLIKGESAIPTLEDTSEPPPPRKWLFVVLGLGVLSTLALACLLIWRGQSASKVKGAGKIPLVTKAQENKGPPAPKKNNPEKPQNP